MNREQRLQWWREARFGMFIHWGLYSELAGEWRGATTPSIGEWIMHDLRIPIAEYEAVAQRFNPVKFDADAWVQLAQDAGMKYLVITAKHHDGFCMFDSPSNPYNIVKRTPFGRDPMKELAEACHRRGIRMCFYYSQAQDWHAPGGAGHWDETVEGQNWLTYARPAADFQHYLDRVVKPNLRELLTQYGPIGLIWFDTPVAITQQQSEALRDLVHELQPECLVSGRIGHDVGDYGSLGDNQHPVGPVTHAWETPATLNDTWGFKKNDHQWKSVDQLLDLLINCASKGVNYLLNVGPTGEGEIPAPSVERLREVGRWLRRHGQAIYGTAASPFPLDPPWGRITRKGRSLYLIVREWPAEPLVLRGVRSRVKSAGLLGGENARVQVSQHDDTITLVLPDRPPEWSYPVVAVTFDQAVEVDPIVHQDGSAMLRLPPYLAELHGAVTAKPDGTFAGWADANNSAAWTFHLVTPGTYEAIVVRRIHRGRTDLYSTATLHLHHDGQTLDRAVGFEGLDHADGAKVYQSVRDRLGELRFDRAGRHTIRLTADGFGAATQRGLAVTELVLRPIA